MFHAMGTVWDGRWYLTIAQHGYPHHLFNEGDGSRWAFFPGFPAAVRALADVTRLSLPDAAVVAAFVFGLTSALAIWLAVREVFGSRLADRAVLLYVFCPTAYVLSLGYTEGLFLTAAAACLFALSRRYWITAALCACVAGLTRNAGIVVVLAVLVAALPAAWRGRAWRPAVAALDRPARARLLHGLRLGDGGHASGVPVGGAILAGPALRLVLCRRSRPSSSRCTRVPAELPSCPTPWPAPRWSSASSASGSSIACRAAYGPLEEPSPPFPPAGGSTRWARC